MTCRYRPSFVSLLGMVASSIQLTPRYVETSQMGFIAHDSYVPWLELGRSTLLREQCLDYRSFEVQGYFLPVLELQLRFLRPAYYDDVLTLLSVLRQRPSFRIRIDYELRRGATLLAEGHTVQIFVSREGKPVRPPAAFMASVQRVFGS